MFRRTHAFHFSCWHGRIIFLIDLLERPLKWPKTPSVMQLISIQSEIGEFNSNSIKSYEVLMPYCVQLVTSWASQLVPMTLSLADPMEGDLFPLLGLGHPYRPYRKPYVFFWNISYIHTCTNRDKTWKNQSRLAQWEACYSLRHHDAIHAVVGPAGPWCRCPPDGTHLPWLRGPRQQLCRCHARRFGEEARKRLWKHNPCGKGRGKQRRSWQVDSTSPGFAAGDVFFFQFSWLIHQNWGIHWIYIYISYLCPLEPMDGGSDVPGWSGDVPLWRWTFRGALWSPAGCRASEWEWMKPTRWTARPKWASTCRMAGWRQPPKSLKCQHPCRIIRGSSSLSSDMTRNPSFSWVVLLCG